NARLGDVKVMAALGAGLRPRLQRRGRETRAERERNKTHENTGERTNLCHQSFLKRCLQWWWPGLQEWWPGLSTRNPGAHDASRALPGFRVLNPGHATANRTST